LLACDTPDANEMMPELLIACTTASRSAWAANRIFVVPESTNQPAPDPSCVSPVIADPPTENDWT